MAPYLLFWTQIQLVASVWIKKRVSRNRILNLLFVLQTVVEFQGEKSSELQDRVRALERGLEDEERKVEELSKKIKTDETGSDFLRDFMSKFYIKSILWRLTTTALKSEPIVLK